MNNTLASELSEFSKELNTLEIFVRDLPDKALRLGVRVVLAIVLFFIGSKLIKLVRKILKKSLIKCKADTGAVTFLDGLVKAVLYLVLILLIAKNFGFDATSIAALLGTMGVTIGLALQGQLSNLAGGVLIMILKPFKVGDYILEKNTNSEGTVLSISIFYTKLLTIDQKTVILPNGNLSNAALVNYSAYPTRLVDISMSIAYHSDIKKAKEVLEGVINNNEKVVKDKEIKVFVSNLGASEIAIGTRCYCNNADYWSVRWALLEDMKTALDENNIEIPFPQVDVHMKA